MAKELTAEQKAAKAAKERERYAMKKLQAQMQEPVKVEEPYVRPEVFKQAHELLAKKAKAVPKPKSENKPKAAKPVEPKEEGKYTTKDGITIGDKVKFTTFISKVEVKGEVTRIFQCTWKPGNKWYAEVTMAGKKYHKLISDLKK